VPVPLVVVCEVVVVVGGTVDGTTVVDGTTCVWVGGTVVGAAAVVVVGADFFGLFAAVRWRGAGRRW
jgi:hypothetical protein